MYEVKQLIKGKFQFESQSLDTEHEVEIFLLDSPEAEPVQSLIKTSQKNFTVIIDNLTYRPYFYVKGQVSSYITAERTLPVDGMNNFRDMGGYETVDGKRVKWGKLYRSDHIHNATEKGLEYLRKLGIHTIIDYRSESEISKYPNPTIANDVLTYCLDPSAHAAELAAQFQSSKENEDLNLINKIIEQRKNGKLVSQHDVVFKQYQTFASSEKSKAAFGDMLRVLAKPEAAAAVQHCRGGKDRTGFGSMLILGVLGVPTEILIKDYLITAKNREERNRIKMEKYKTLTNDPVVLEHLYSFIDTKSKFLEASIQSIVSKNGSIVQYVKDELEISQEIIDILKSLYLE